MTKRSGDRNSADEPAFKRPPTPPTPPPARENSGKATWVNPGGPSVPRTKHAFKVLLPESLVSLLLGSQAQVKEMIQKETGARLVFSSRGDYFPQTRFRVLGIFADEPSMILKVFDLLMPQLVDLGNEERKEQSGQHHSDLTGKEAGEYIFRFILTRRMQSQIVGTGGCNIKHIRQDSGAKVFLSNESTMAHRQGKIIGPPAALLSALAHINNFVQSESEFQEEFYHGYSRIINFMEAESRGWVPPPEPKDALGPKKGTSGRGEHRKVPAPPQPGDVEEADPGEDVDSLTETLESFPAGTVGLQYSLCCEVPADRVPALMGPSGEAAKEIEEEAGVRIDVERSGEWHDEKRTITLEGPLLNLYIAHAMVMSRLKGIEEEERRAENPEENEQEEQHEEDAEHVTDGEAGEAEEPEESHFAEPEDVAEEAQEDIKQDESKAPISFLDDDEDDEDPDIIRAQIDHLQAKLVRVLARRAAREAYAKMKESEK